jgi:flagellar biogenesis protein FliO
MNRIKWIFVLPILAAVLVLLPVLIPSKANPGNQGPAGPSISTWKRGGTEAGLQGPSVLTLTTSLGIVLLLGVGTIVILRRVQRGSVNSPEREVVVKESRRLSPKRTIHLVRAVDRLLLISESEMGVQLLSDLTPREETAAQPAAVVVPQVAIPQPEPEPALPEEEGATPRDLLLPRNERARQAAIKASAKLSNFRELMTKLAAEK